MVTPRAGGPHDTEWRITVLRANCLEILGEITTHIENDIPLEGGWPTVSEYADIARRLLELRNQLLRQGEFAPENTAPPNRPQRP